MKKHILFFSNLIVILSIVAGFMGVVYKDTKAYQNLAEKQLKDTVSLADINISKHIENTMAKPVMVSKTMANDEFLKAWLFQEPENDGDDLYMSQLYSYLKTYQEKYEYSTVFCISAQTGNYYYQDGLHKTISKSDEHDIWYYNFIDSGLEYDLEVDTNEENSGDITVFVNFRVEGDDGILLGVIGVGLQVACLEDTIQSYMQDYELAVYIINVGGVKNSFTGDTNIFVSEDELKKRTGIQEKIVMSKTDEPKMQWFTVGGERKCLTTQYDETLGWYLILEKETDSITSAFERRIKSNMIFVLISFMVCILVTTVVFINYNRRIISMENMDELTGLANRKLFFMQYPEFVQKNRKSKMSLFMIDIDHFKAINDTSGHLFGNAVLAMVGEELQRAVGQQGIAARWGGDEFFGVMAVEPREAERTLNQFMETLKTEGADSRYCVTVSVGITEVNSRLNSEQVLKEVDEALYCSKKGGRDRITIYDENPSA